MGGIEFDRSTNLVSKGVEDQREQFAHVVGGVGQGSISAGLAALLAGLASVLPGLIAFLIHSRGDVALGTKVDQTVEWLLMMGGPVTVTVWHGLTIRQSALSKWRLAVLFLLLAALIFLGQTLVGLFTSKLMLFGLDRGVSRADLLTGYVVLKPVFLAVMAMLVSWGLIRVLAGPVPVVLRRALGSASDYWAAVVALGFGLMVYANWVDGRLPWVDWPDFFPAGLSGLIKVSVALIFSAGVMLILRPFVSSVPAFTWLLGTPWAAAMAALSLLGSSWGLAQLWGADLQFAHGLLGFVSAMLLCSLLCLLPLVVWQRWRH